MNKSKVGELIIENKSCQYGLGLAAEEYDENKIRYLRISDIDDFGNLLDSDKKSVSANDIENYILKENELVVARTGNSTGRTYVYTENDGKLAYAGFLIKYVFDESKINPRYMKYYTLSNAYKTQIKGFNGSTRGNMNAQDFKNIVVSYPERYIQDKMVALFDNITEKIKTNNHTNSELESMAKAIYDYWFLQFEFPNEEGKPYKSSGGKMVWNEELKREIPEGWKIKKIEDFCDIFTGKKDVNQALSAGKYKFYSCSPDYKYSNDLLYSGKAILVSGNGSYTGRTIFVDDSFDLYQRTYATVLKDNQPDVLEYIYYSMKKFFVPRVSGGTHGSAIPYIVYNDIAKEKIAWDEKTVDLFTTKIRPIQKQILSLHKQNQQLSSLRDWLLPMLMNGQVTFKDENISS